MSAGALCLRCRKYAQDCLCVYPRPSADGVHALNRPGVADWRAEEYNLALAAGVMYRMSSRVGGEKAVGQ